MEQKISFAILDISKNRTDKIELYEYDTVEVLKNRIEDIFDIPPHNQYIEGWVNSPEDDQIILQFCSSINRINYLSVINLDADYLSKEITNNIGEKGLEEIEAAKSCFKKISNHLSISHIHFNITCLKEAIDRAFLKPPEERKVLLLYMHNSQETFSKQFLRLINYKSINNILLKSFDFLGWDVENEKYHNALCQALISCDLAHLCNFVETQICVAVIIQYINKEYKVMAALVDDLTEDNFLEYFKNSQDFLFAERMRDTDAEEEEEEGENTEMDSSAFQKLMADRLGDRDYDCFAFNEHEYLEAKIGFALYGPPQKETGYEENEKQQIEIFYQVIMKNSAKWTEFKDQVEMSIIFNCTEPRVNDKKTRKKKNPNYNPNTDILPVPIFILRKCRGSNNPCRIFIDQVGRKYESWDQYINRNTLGKCVMVLPKNGRYMVEGNKVVLEKYESPACNPVKQLLRVGDIASMAGGLGSGGVMFAAGVASITTIAVAPAAIITASVVGAGAGVYGLGRSIGNLVDRVKHEESLSFANAEARAIYFNLLAGSLGFVGAGANMAVSQLAANGVNIGKGVGVAVNTIGVANIGVSGASIFNSGFDVFDQWLNENQTPSLLTMLQLSTSILFFGNAVYGFKTCQRIVDETQAKVLQDYSESLRSNRHRKTLNKLMKETIRRNESNQVRGRAEVIKTIRNIPNKDEVFAVLTRSNKAMNEKGVKFFATNGEINLNGESINMNEFIMMNKQEASAFLSNLPTKSDITAAEKTAIIQNFSLDSWSLPNVQQFAEYALRLIGIFGTNVQGMLLQIVHDLIPIVTKIFQNLLDEIFPENSTTVKMLCILIEYFGGRAYEILNNYNKWRQTGSHFYYNKDFADAPARKSERYLWIFAKLVKLCFKTGQINEYDLKDIIKFCEKFIINEVYIYMEKREKNEERRKHSPIQPKKKDCPICSGYYFINTS